MQQALQLRRRNRRMLLFYMIERRRRRQQHGHHGRRAWAWPRPQHWFKTLLINHDLDILWKQNFRITRPTFEYICDLVRGDLQKNATRMRQPVTVEERVGLSLWRLATGNSYRTCGLQFGLGKSTAKCICKEFEEAMVFLKNRFIVFPTTRDEIEQKMQDFKDKYGIPQIVGAVDGSHIEINAPPNNHEDYFNRKQHYSINLQGIVDSDLKFIHASAGYPGSIHDSLVLRLSGISDLAENKQILAGPTKIVNGVEIGPLLAADGAYKLRPWIMKPYVDRGRLTQQQRKFNRRFSALRCVVENAFGMLKSRWGIVLKKIEQHLKSMKTTVIATCVLHNICIERGDMYDMSDSDSSDDDSSDDDGGGLETGDDIRDALKEYVWTNL